MHDVVCDGELEEEDSANEVCLDQLDCENME